MVKRTQSEHAEIRYATCEDFLKIFCEEMRGFYQLSFLLTGDHQKAERCFAGGMDDCVKENRVFREWARSWAKRVIVKNAIRELHPQSRHSNSSVRVKPQFSDPSEHFGKDAVSRLGDFERFVFVLCVLERYGEHDCALLLGCSASEVREARTQALEELVNFRDGELHGVEIEQSV